MTAKKKNKNDSGVDKSLVAMFLKLSPEERLRINDSLASTILELRNAKIRFYQDVSKLDDLAEGIYVDPDPSEKLLEGEVSAYLQLLRQRKKRGEKQVITENDRQYIRQQLSVSSISDDKVQKMIESIVKAGICKDENEVIRRAVESFFVTVFPLSHALRKKS